MFIPLKSRVSIAVAAALLLVLTACSGGSDSSSKEDTLKIAWSSVPTQLDPNVYTGLTSVWATNAYLATLLEYDISGGTTSALGVEDLEPGLAETYEVSEDGTSVQMTLREGVKSAAGNELTTEDVKWSFERMLTSDSGLAAALMMPTANVDTDNPIEIIDDYTFTYNLTAPSAVSLSILAYPVLGILDSTEVKKHVTDDDPWADEWLKNNTAGFGAYTLDSFDPGNEIQFTANPNYYGSRNFDSVIIRSVPDGAARTQLLTSGEVHIASEPPLETLETIDAASGVSVLEQPDTNRHNLSVNARDEVFGTPQVRRAISHAINRDAIVDSIYKGRATPAMHPQPKALREDQPDVGAYDPELAKQLLAEAGYGDGLTMQLAFNTGRPGPFAENLARLIQNDLKAVGIEVALNAVPTLPDFEAAVSEGRYQAYLYTERPAQPDIAYGMFLYQESTSSLNSSGYSNAEFDSLVREALALPLGDERDAVVGEGLDLLAEELPIISLVEVPSLVAISDQITSYVTVPAGGVRFDQLGIK